MRLFLYEHLTAGGPLTGAGAISESLLVEGLAMASAVGDDLARVPDVELRLLADERLAVAPLPGKTVFVKSDAERIQAFAAAVRWSDGVILIAPESDGVLPQLAKTVRTLGGRLLSPDESFIELAANKQRTVEVLAAAGVPVPRGIVWRPGDLPAVGFPAVIKPIDGCGSQGVRLIVSAKGLPNQGEFWRLETYHPGPAVSVALLCGANHGPIALPACTQRLSDDGQFRYLGGETPLPRPLNERACRLARRAIDVLSAHSPPVGYVGVDMILGDDAEGQDDVVIEVNPRVTTSYVGLRRACQGNLGEMMLRTALGRAVTVEFHSQRIEFDASGNVTVDRTSHS